MRRRGKRVPEGRAFCRSFSISWAEGAGPVRYSAKPSLFLFSLLSLLSFFFLTLFLSFSGYSSLSISFSLCLLLSSYYSFFSLLLFMWVSDINALLFIFISFSFVSSGLHNEPSNSWTSPGRCHVSTLVSTSKMWWGRSLVTASSSMLCHSSSSIKSECLDALQPFGSGISSSDPPCSIISSLPVNWLTHREKMTSLSIHSVVPSCFSFVANASSLFAALSEFTSTFVG